MLKGGRATLERLPNWRARRLSRDASLANASVWHEPPQAPRPLAVTEVRPATGLDPELVPILGEFAWHSITVDPRLAAVSQEHYAVVAGPIADAGMRRSQDLRILESRPTHYDRLHAVPATWCAHGSARHFAEHVELVAGRRAEHGLPTDGTTCVAGDFRLAMTITIRRCLYLLGVAHGALGARTAT